MGICCAMIIHKEIKYNSKEFVPMVYKVAIVEDEKEEQERLKSFLEKYQEESGVIFNANVFSNGLDFFSYIADYDIIFLDIQMEGMDGMETARRLRENNSEALIVFVTNLVQYAVDGYAVKAYDFFVKPLNYYNFSMKLERICTHLSHLNNDDVLSVTTRNEVRNLKISDIKYVEVRNHNLVYHMVGGDIEVRQTMKSIEDKLAEHYFVKCNAHYLVNVKYVSKFKGEYVVVGDDELRVSQSKRQSFLSEVAKFFGGTI